MKDKINQAMDPENKGERSLHELENGNGDHTVFRSSHAANQNAKSTVPPSVENDATRINKPPFKDGDNKITDRQKQNTNYADATRIRGNNNPDNNTKLQDAVQKSPLGSRRDATRKASASYKSQRVVLKERFTLEKVIGVGGMGVVYKAKDRLKVEARDREPYVAIKVLSDEFKSHPESFIALQRESRKTQRIAHPNVVKVYDFDRDGDTVFMTMEYMEGAPLDQLIRQYSATGLPRDEAWMILYGLCSALMHAHAEKIVHSDFKPGNIFVTDAGTPKIFDFGIARAVANVDRQAGNLKDKTVFDAGSLGALTPAYASMEMLQGQEPDVRDDIYALGCIAYEILTGSHPFNRIPADEAYKSRLKPKRITTIKKRQWRAIEKALMFKRADRISTVDEFYHLIQKKSRSLSLLLPTTLVLIAIGISTYFIVTRETRTVSDNTVQVDKIEFNIRYELFKKKIVKLMQERSFTAEWEGVLWDEVSGLTTLLKNQPDKWLLAERNKIYKLYLSEYLAAVQTVDYVRAGRLLDNAYKYTDYPDYLDAQKSKLATLIENLKKDQYAKKLDRQKKEMDLQNISKKAKRDDYQFSLALKNVNQQLECQSRLDMRGFSIAINKLRSINVTRYTRLENTFVTALASCITHIGKSQPERALEDKKYALRIFADNSLIKDIHIAPRDACNGSIAGLGSHGERAVCRDKITGLGEGPAMVVIPGNGRINTFAIGKYEISIKDINLYCKKSLSCSQITAQNDAMPVVNINISLAKNYIRWLSALTKHKYRLPTLEEWRYAAKANSNYQDPNRNCALNSRGIEKGGQLVRANTGVQNHWGLVNYLGNAREWVYDRSHKLDAVGGSFLDSMDQCNIRTVVSHSGKADNRTGFRVVREVTR